MLSATLSAETANSDTSDDTTEIRLSLVVTNDGSDPVTVRFRTGQRADFIAHDTDTGDQVWRHAEGRMFTQVLGSETLAPGDSATYEGTWSDPPAGSYRVMGELAAEEQETTAQTTVTVG